MEVKTSGSEGKRKQRQGKDGHGTVSQILVGIGNRTAKRHARIALSYVEQVPDPGKCQLDAKFPPSLYVKNPPSLVEPARQSWQFAGNRPVPGCVLGGRWRVLRAAEGRPEPRFPDVLSPPPSPPRGPAGCGKRAAFSKGCGRVPGGGRGRQPSIPRQTAGRGDGGPGEEGRFPQKTCGKTTHDDRAGPGMDSPRLPGRSIPLKSAAPQGRPGRPRWRCRAHCASVGQPCASP
jgi:hypothetical protein